MGDNITIPYQDGSIPAYRVKPEGDGKHPALILIHEVWGLTDHVRDVADRLAAEGYGVVAPDLLAGTELEKLITPDLFEAMADPEKRTARQPELRAIMTPLSSPEFGQATNDKLAGCFAMLQANERLTKVGAIGFCFGGTYSFNLAINEPELAAAVPFYGHNNHSVKELAKIKSPVMAFYGDQDIRLMDELPDLSERMKQAGVNFQYKVYEGAGHAFFNDANPLTYNKEAAEDSWKRTLTFLGENLKG